MKEALEALAETAELHRVACARAKGANARSPERAEARELAARRDAQIVDLADAHVPYSPIAGAARLSVARVTQIVQRSRADRRREEEVVDLVRGHSLRLVPLAPLARRVGMPIDWVQGVLSRAADEVRRDPRR